MMRPIAAGIAISLILGAMLGCTRQAEDPAVKVALEALNARQTALVERFSALEAENAALKAELKALNRPVPATVATSASRIAQSSTTNPIPEQQFEALAQAIGNTMTARLYPDLERIIDGRIAAQVGTAEDIESFFVDAFDEQMDEREERARDARNAQEQERRVRSARGQVERMGNVVGISESQADRVIEAYLVRNESTRSAVRALREEGRFSMTAYRKIRDDSEVAYQQDMQSIMTSEQYEIYQTKWRNSNRTGRSSRNTDSSDAER